MSATTAVMQGGVSSVVALESQMPTTAKNAQYKRKMYVYSCIIYGSSIFFKDIALIANFEFLGLVQCFDNQLAFSFSLCAERWMPKDY